jgi:hypothetical protein
MNNYILARLDLSDDNILWQTKVDVSFFLESIKVCLLLQSLPRCNQNQTSDQKESLKKLFNNEDSISKFELRQFFEKMIHTLFLTKVCPEEDINEVCEIMTESVTEFTNLIFDHIYLDKDRKLNLENVFEQLEHQAGDQLCNFSPHLSKFIKFQDQPCEYQCDSEESSERPGKELSFLYLLSLHNRFHHSY